MFKGRRGAVKRERWEPKKWLPKYDIMLAMWFTGVMKQDAIASHFKVHKQVVNYVVNSDQGRLKLAEMQAKQKVKLEKDLGFRLDNMMHKAIDNMERVINDPILLAESPFSIFDRSLAVAKGLGKLNKAPEDKGVVNNNLVIADKEVAARLLKGLDLSNQVNQIHSGVGLLDKGKEVKGG